MSLIFLNGINDSSISDFICGPYWHFAFNRHLPVQEASRGLGPFVICLVSLSGYVGYHIWRFRNGSLYQDKFIGRYESNSGQYLELQNDNTWFSGAGLFKCNEGTWEYKMSEDWNYIELTCKGETTSFDQISGEDDNTLNCRVGYDSSGHDIRIDLEKVN